MTALEVRVILLCLILNMVDGSDVLVVSYAAPALTADWKVTAETLGLIFSAGLAGMTIGAAFIAPLADRIGRRAIVLFALAIVTVGMAASSLATGVAELSGLRLFVGLGIGAMLASVTALVSEFAPSGRRSLAVTIAVAGYPLGAVATGFVSAYVIPLYGWQALFLTASVISAILLPVIFLSLPESEEFLLARRPKGALARVNRTRLGRGEPAWDALPPQQDVLRASVGALFTARHRRATLFVWGAFFATFMTLYFLTSWIPKIAVDAGLPVTRAILAGALFNLGAVAGVVVLGWLALTKALTRSIAFFFAAGPILMIVFGFHHTPETLLLIEIFCLGFLIQGGFSGLYAVAARFYPAAIRSTGIGWALGAGRLGAVVGPALGGWTMGQGFTLAQNFILFAVPIALAGVFMWSIGEPADE